MPLVINTVMHLVIHPVIHPVINPVLHPFIHKYSNHSFTHSNLLITFSRTDPSTSSILEAMRSGVMSMKQAADALGMEPAMLAYHLAAKVNLRK